MHSNYSALQFASSGPPPGSVSLGFPARSAEALLTLPHLEHQLCERGLAVTAHYHERRARSTQLVAADGKQRTPFLQEHCGRGKGEERREHGGGSWSLNRTASCYPNASASTFSSCLVHMRVGQCWKWGESLLFWLFFLKNRHKHNSVFAHMYIHIYFKAVAKCSSGKKS